MELTTRIFAKKFRLDKRIGAGSFGFVYSAVDITSGMEVAVKLEPTNSRHQLSSYEAKVLRQLRGGVGIPQIYWHGCEDDYNIIVLQQLGSSLEDLLHSCNHVLSLKTTIMIMLQLLTRIEYIHSQNFIHRDIKPDNFLIGRDASKCIFAIDFGLAKKYRDPSSHQHISYRENKSLTGTARYVSITTHMGIEQSRRDDIESIGYMLVYFLKGSLPWQGVEGDTKQEKYAKIMDRKINTKLDSLCRGLPPEFAILVQYARGLKFEEKPDYRYLSSVFLNLASRESISIDNNFDWQIPRITTTTTELVIESLAPPEIKKRRTKRRRSAQGSMSQLMRLSNVSSSKLCEIDSDITDEMIKAPNIRDRSAFNFRLNTEFVKSKETCCIM